MNIISGIRSVIGSAIALCTVGTASIASAQDMQVRGSGAGTSYIIDAQNNSTASSDKIAVYGKSTPVAYYGIGGKFEGGYMGVYGNATISGSGTRYGGYFNAGAGLYNYGVYGYAYGPSGSSNYGIYGYGGGGSTNYAGYFSGNVVVTGTFSNPSDMRLKLNIRDMSSSLGLVLKLRPRTYQFKTAEFSSMGLPEGDQLGLIAQEVQAVFPQLVSEVAVPGPHGKDAAVAVGQPTKILSIDYVKLVPVLVKAIQEQQAQIDELKAQLGKK